MCFRQEQVHEGVYSPLEVKVETKKEMILCRTYKMNNFRPCPPSPQYKKVHFTPIISLTDQNKSICALTGDLDSCVLMV